VTGEIPPKGCFWAGGQGSQSPGLQNKGRAVLLHTVVTDFVHCSKAKQVPTSSAPPSVPPLYLHDPERDTLYPYFVANSGLLGIRLGISLDIRLFISGRVYPVTSSIDL
jgi:hypothetical protein